MSSGRGYANFVGGVTWIGTPRKTNSGKSVVNISVAVSEDRFDDETKEWVQDGNGKYFESVTIFGRMADNIVASLKPGDRVAVQGPRHPKPKYTDKNGVEHDNENQVIADSVALDLTIYPAHFDRPAGRGGHGDNRQAAAPAAAPKATRKAAAPKAAPKTEDVFGDDDEDGDW